MYLGQKDLNAGIFVIPRELRDSPPNSTKGSSILRGIVEVVLIVGCLIKPCGCP